MLKHRLLSAICAFVCATASGAAVNPAQPSDVPHSGAASPTPVQSPPSNLVGAVLGPDGAYYSLYYDNPSASSTIIERITRQGSVTKLHDFSLDIDGSPFLDGLDQLRVSADGSLSNATASVTLD